MYFNFVRDKLTDKTTTYQLLYHFFNGTYGYNSDVVDDVFTKMHTKDLFFEFLKNYEEEYIDNLLWKKYGNKQAFPKEPAHQIAASGASVTKESEPHADMKGNINDDLWNQSSEETSL